MIKTVICLSLSLPVLQDMGGHGFPQFPVIRIFSPLWTILLFEELVLPSFWLKLAGPNWQTTDNMGGGGVHEHGILTVTDCLWCKTKMQEDSIAARIERSGHLTTPRFLCKINQHVMIGSWLTLFCISLSLPRRNYASASVSREIKSKKKEVPIIYSVCGEDLEHEEIEAEMTQNNTHLFSGFLFSCPQCSLWALLSASPLSSLCPKIFTLIVISSSDLEFSEK